MFTLTYTLDRRDFSSVGILVLSGFRVVGILVLSGFWIVGILVLSEFLLVGISGPDPVSTDSAKIKSSQSEANRYVNQNQPSIFMNVLDCPDQLTFERSKIHLYCISLNCKHCVFKLNRFGSTLCLSVVCLCLLAYC